MFAAVALFVILLLGILYVLFLRFGNPRAPAGAPPAPAALLRTVPSAAAPGYSLRSGSMELAFAQAPAEAEMNG